MTTPRYARVLGLRAMGQHFSDFYRALCKALKTL